MVQGAAGQHVCPEGQGAGRRSRIRVVDRKTRASLTFRPSQVAALGLGAVLAYGIFDGVSYTAAFSIAFLSYEKATGLNPTANIKAILSIMVAMWAGNNVTRCAHGQDEYGMTGKVLHAATSSYESLLPNLAKFNA